MEPTGQQVVGENAIDFNFDDPSLTGQADLLRWALPEVATSGDLDALLRYQPLARRLQDRAAIARHLRRRGITMDADPNLIVNAAQPGLTVTVMGR
ncbi:hypothetical protein AB0N28_24395 [Streptomyces sp. NPDC051130]|uniref:hypothetical protein n=1 Tax=Streptomyces sp. NPDC051130 TaxID=3157223 RepID=UPI00343E9805